MTRIITGKMPRIEKKAVKQSLAFERRDEEEFQRYVKRDYEIPKEAALTTEKNEALMFTEYTWTWYEVEI